MSTVRNLYKVIRSVLFTAVLVVIGVVGLLYLLVSIPAVQNELRVKAQTEISKFLKSKVEIGAIELLPFNEIKLFNVNIYSPDQKLCLEVGKLAGGIDLWKLITERRIVVGYAELIELNAQIYQSDKDGPLNIQFIIDALKPKDKTKPPTQFDVVLHNIVIRKSSIAFDRLWIPQASNSRQIDFNHLKLSDVRADIAIPQLKNDDFIVDLRRIAFNDKSGLMVRSIAVKTHITPSLISIQNLRLRLPKSEISVGDFDIAFNGYSDIPRALINSSHNLELNANPIIPSELSPFYPPLANFDNEYILKLYAVGNLSRIHINELSLRGVSRDINFRAAASGNYLDNPNKRVISIESFELDAKTEFINKCFSLIPKYNPELKSIIDNLGDINLIASGKCNMATHSSQLTFGLKSAAGDLSTDTNIKWDTDKFIAGDILLKSNEFNLSAITPTLNIGEVSINLKAEGRVNLKSPMESEGSFDLNIPYINYKGSKIENIAMIGNKTGNSVNGTINIQDPLATLNADLNCVLANLESNWNINANISSFYPSKFGISPEGAGISLAGIAAINLKGNTIESLTGEIDLQDFDFTNKGKLYHLDNLNVQSYNDGESRIYDISTDFLQAKLSGHFDPIHIINAVKYQLSSSFPDFIFSKPKDSLYLNEYCDLNLSLDADAKFYESIGSNFRPGVPVNISAHFTDSPEGSNLKISAPYLIQGKNKLIKNTGISIDISNDSGLSAHIVSEYPMKKDIANLDFNIHAHNNNISTDLAWIMNNTPENAGKIKAGVDICKNLQTGKADIYAQLFESEFMLNNSNWKVDPARIQFVGNVLDVKDVHIAHDNQYIDINGRASQNADDKLFIDLSEVDLDYIFDILNINYVNFGGLATGKVNASSLFTKTPVAQTDGLYVEKFAYNDCVLGNANLESHWDHLNKMVAINADIDGGGNSSAKVRGGVFVTRDSLSFDFDTHKLDIEFLKPFMSGFTSSMKGNATGHVKLFGTFSDMDLQGKVFADTITMKVDHTQVYYSGSDTIYFDHNKIRIPHIRLYDKYGNSGILRGEVRHRYLHDAMFDFDITDARNLLAYDTGPKFNPKWYGKIFAGGNASLRGRPGIVSIDINMSTAEKSDFTLVLEETEVAADYEFLTFTDSHKINEIVEEKDEITFEDLFKKKEEEKERVKSDIFTLNMALDVNPGANMNIIMDPAAGDKIRARGDGALRLQYDSETDNFRMYGKYTLQQGYYNFSLQDLILKNFKIERGSSISFNGDPLQGLLDITASYRVNTNLTDLDKSFSEDPDLNRTNVPVDALLKVSGDIHAPEINFDLRLPTVTSEVERKVRSIISTEDMMNRQAIYLLALNRFYTPEYMQSDQGGGELASVASSTISSQISNIISSLTDKFSLSPSFKSEKSDFSDMEVDVALSSSLFDNRLLINGNFGYRDKSTSQTTFIGDFDIEYLLSKDGKLRLKAYNHFNDASYYLKSSLTTQGVGVIYRKDFDYPFTFLHRLFKHGQNKKKKSLK